jgi:hypothetical protein
MSRHPAAIHGVQKEFAMDTTSLSWNAIDGWRRQKAQLVPNLVLYFGSRETLTDAGRYRELREMFPDACLMGCSTDGQICRDEIIESGVNAIGVRFDATTIRTAIETVENASHSRIYGEAIGRALKSDDLAGVFVLSDGLAVNGSELVAGIATHVGNVPISGGLAGDGSQFVETVVGLDCTPGSRKIAAIGLYGDSIRIGHGSAGGWDVFGPKRRITSAQGNVLFQLDGRPALDLYERYLGEDEIEALPGSALLFPLQIHDPRRPDHQLVRTVLAVDRDKRSMTFAGDMPEGWVAQLMRGNFDRLASGAANAAQLARNDLGDLEGGDGVAILVSCIGRKLLMGQQVASEIEAAGTVLGSRLSRIGFYSYGEITPHATSGTCELHNQTMTITTMVERQGGHG